MMHAGATDWTIVVCDLAGNGCQDSSNDPRLTLQKCRQDQRVETFTLRRCQRGFRRQTVAADDQVANPRQRRIARLGGLGDFAAHAAFQPPANSHRGLVQDVCSVQAR
jgi:hypothetical protein